jgi:hypothetical protein
MAIRSMRLLRSGFIAVAACAIGYLLLGQVIASYISRTARQSAVRSDQFPLHTPVPDRPEPTAAIRSPAERVRDTFEHFPGSRRPAIKPRSNRGDGIMFG